MHLPKDIIEISSQKEGLFLVRMALAMKSSNESIRHWGEISKFIGSSQSVVDRTGATTTPCRMIVGDESKLPAPVEKFSKSYEEICAERVQEILAIQARLDKPIALLYSGGIDSTVVAIAFLKALGPTEFRKRVVVYLSQDSVNENPTFYFNFLRRMARLESSTLYKSLFDGRQIVVGAEFNDQLHGSLLLSGLMNVYDSEVIHRRFSFDFLRENFQRCKMSDEASRKWIEYIDFILSSQSRFEVDTVFNFFWWFNFIFKWQSVFYRIPLRTLVHLRPNVDAEFLSTQYQQFFNSVDFQHWSIWNPNFRIKDKWSTYKWHAKDLIFDFTKDSNYRDHKIKVGSLHALFWHSTSPIAMTSKYRFLHERDLNFEEFYEPNCLFGNIAT